jgi:hypothetical protein
LRRKREPMTLFELQEWLGYHSPEATQHYVKTTPMKLVKSYADAGYFGRNVRAIEVLIDQESVRNGQAINEPWKFYDLGQHAASPIMPSSEPTICWEALELCDLNHPLATSEASVGRSSACKSCKSELPQKGSSEV